MGNLNAIAEFGTSKIICLIDSKASKNLDLPGTSCVRYEGMRKGAWINAETVLAGLELAIETAEKRSSRQIHSIIVGLPAACAIVVTKEVTMNVPNGMVSSELITRMAEPAKLNDPKLVLTDVRPVYFLDSAGDLYVDLPIGVQTSRITAVFSYVYAKRKFVDDVTGMLDNMHIYVERFIYEPYAQAVKFIPEKERLNAAILLDVGYTETSVSVVYNDAVLATSLIGVGGQTFVNDLMTEMHVSAGTAEHLKRSHSFGISVNRAGTVYAKNEEGRMVPFNQGEVSDVMEARMYSFADSVKKAIASFVKKKIISRNTSVYLSGAGLSIRGAEVFLQNCLNKRVTTCKPKVRTTLAPVYYTALMLLDNSRDTVYDLCGGVYHGQIKHKIGKILR